MTRLLIIIISSPPIRFCNFCLKSEKTRIEVFQDSTKVTLFSEMEFSNIPMEDKLWSCYLHACLMYIQGDALTNKSLRDRFGIPETSSSSSSRLIKEAINKGLIKILDPNTAPRYMKYIPIWA